MFDPFVLKTKDTRYYALKGVLYSMVVCIAVVGMKQISYREHSLVARFGGVGLVGVGMYCLKVMHGTRNAFASLRKESKERAKARLKGSMHTVRLAVAAKVGGSPWSNVAAAAGATARTPRRTLNGFDIDKLKAQIEKENKEEEGGGKEELNHDTEVVKDGGGGGGEEVDEQEQPLAIKKEV